MPEDKKERQYIALSSILPYDHFRTVESFDMAKAKIEMKAEIGLKAPFMDRLEFRLPWDGALLGYVRRTKALDDLCRGEGVDPERAGRRAGEEELQLLRHPGRDEDAARKML